MGIEVGIVGLGSFGSAFVDLFVRHPAVDRIALCDREPEKITRFAEQLAGNAKFDPEHCYMSLDEILDADLDAIALFTQPWLHARQAIEVMKAGKHVYSAVPVITLPDGDEILDWCDRLIQTCERTGMYYMLGETTYYRPSAMYCRRRAAEGAFGEFIYAEGQYFHDVSHGLRHVRESRRTGAAGEEWVEKMEDYRNRGIKTGPMHYPTHSSSGPVCVMNAHALNVTAYGLEPPADDPYFAEMRFSNETAFFEMSNGAAVRLCEYRHIGLPGQESFSIFGTEGSYHEGTWRTAQGIEQLTPQQMRDPLPDPVREAFIGARSESEAYGGHGGSHAYLVHEFVDAIANDRQPVITAWQAVRYMVMGVMAHKSAMKDGERLEVPDWGPGPQ